MAKFGDDRPNDLRDRRRKKKENIAKYNVGSASYHCRAA